MKAVTITQVQKVQVMEYSMPEVGPNDVLIQIKACALCTMEQRIYLGKKDVGGYPVIAGHEASGIVVQVGQQVKHCKVGDHVVSTDPYCGTCYYCRTGRASQCHSGIADAVYKRPDGAINMVGYLAEYIAVDQSRVIVVSDALPFEQAALTEPLACCLHSVNKAEIQLGDVVVVIGAGVMGLLHVQLAKRRGAYVILAEVDPARREKALAIGADDAFDSTKTDPAAYIEKKVGVRGVQVVFNTTAVHEVWAQALSMLSPYGKLIAYSSQYPDTPVPIHMGEVHNTEIEIIGTVSPNQADMYNAAWLIESGLIDVKPVIQELVPMAQGAEAFEKAVVPGAYRIVITM